MIIQAYNNEPFFLSLNLSRWAALYDLTSSVLLMQCRRKLDQSAVDLEFRTGGSIGTATFQASSNLMILSAPIAAVRGLSNAYFFDFGAIPPGLEFKRFDGGTINFDVGSTRTP